MQTISVPHDGGYMIGCLAHISKPGPKLHEMLELLKVLEVLEVLEVHEVLELPEMLELLEPLESHDRASPKIRFHNLIFHEYSISQVRCPRINGHRHIPSALQNTSDYPLGLRTLYTVRRQPGQGNNQKETAR